MMYTIIDSDGFAKTMKIPGIAGNFDVCPVFLRLKDARLCLKALPVQEGRKIVKAEVRVLQL